METLLNTDMFDVEQTQDVAVVRGPEGLGAKMSPSEARSFAQRVLAAADSIDPAPAYQKPLG